MGSSAYTAPLKDSIACESTVAGQVFKRLETEGGLASPPLIIDTMSVFCVGFIALQGEVLDSGGARGKSKNNGRAKTKGRQPRRKTMQKPLYAFVGASTLSQAYKDYFDPGPEVEKKVLGLSDLVSDPSVVLAAF